MRLNQSVKTEKGLIFVGFNERNRLILNQVRGILLCLRAEVAPQHLAMVIVPKKVGIIMVRLPLAVVAIEAIEPHLEWLTDTARRTEAPLAEQACCVARFTEHVRHGDGIGRHWLLPFRHQFGIPTHHRMTDVFTR